MGGSNIRKGESGFLICSACSKFLRVLLINLGRLLNDKMKNHNQFLISCIPAHDLQSMKETTQIIYFEKNVSQRNLQLQLKSSINQQYRPRRKY